MKKYHFITFFCFVVCSCSQTPTVEEEVVENLPTNPKVSQRAVTQKDKEIMPNDPSYRPIRMEGVESIAVPTGSLFQPDNEASLYQLHRKYQVGDMILVKLSESTTSKKSVDFQTDKSSRFELGPVNVTAGPIQIDESDLDIEHNQENEFDTSSEANQSNSLTGDITVYVKEVLPNRNLVVAGEKWITLNTGQEYVRFSGEIRTDDIDASNTIISSKVGNSRIEYSGKGELHSNQEESVINKLFGIFN
ncbi:MAG: flagellar basal body L-ring protein FlgH [Aliiglaciecola sp.]|uniref:flagellar basal body L-ring protein FlgH n=1 Tax=Aliiglaciecola sp. TaxID=1872441 RepID=UPI003298FD1B